MQGSERQLSLSTPIGDVPAVIYDTLDSTSSHLRRLLCTQRLPAGYTVLARAQTAGRGRQGKRFFSPRGTGLYLSLPLYPAAQDSAALSVTVTVAVTVCRTIEALSGQTAEIKWVNDIFVRGRKVCGILTEGLFLPDGGFAAILGVGVNLAPPPDGFPPEIKETAGAIFPVADDALFLHFAETFVVEFFSLYHTDCTDEYRARSLLPGKRIFVQTNGDRLPALALDVDPACHLRVRFDDGTETALHSGEVSVRTE